MTACDKEVIPSSPDNDTLSDSEQLEDIEDIYHSWFGKEEFDDGAYKTHMWEFDTMMEGHYRCEEYNTDGTFKEVEVDETFTFTYDEDTKVLETSIYDEYLTPNGTERQYWTYTAEIIDSKLRLTDQNSNKSMLLSILIESNQK